MAKKEPVTQAVRELRKHKVAFEGHLYEYVAAGGTRQFADLMGLDEHLIIKTLIMQDTGGKPLVMLMHGDREVSTRSLARSIGVKSIQPCLPQVADRHSGYQVGGTSPFGLRTVMPVYCERSISGLSRIYINGGKRGYIISLQSDDLLRVLQPVLVNAAADRA